MTLYSRVQYFLSSEALKVTNASNGKLFEFLLFLIFRICFTVYMSTRFPKSLRTRGDTEDDQASLLAIDVNMKAVNFGEILRN